MIMNIIRELRLKRGMNMRETAKAIGIPYTTYVNYEKGEREPNSEMLLRLSDFFGVSIDTLIGRNPEENDIFLFDNILPMPRMQKIPLLGNIACGEPLTAVENSDEYVAVPEGITADFALRAKGDSMINARIFDGDIVYIRSQPEVENGEIAAVIIGDEATLKRVYRYPNRLELRPENPAFPVLNYEDKEMRPIRILGKAVGFTSVHIR